MSLCTCTVVTPRIVGTGIAAAETTDLFALENGRNSKRLVRVRRLVAQLDATALLTAVMPQLKTSRGTGFVLDGLSLDKGRFDTTTTSDVNVRAWCSVSSDAQGGVSIMDATEGVAIWKQYAMRRHTAAEQVIGDDNSMIPLLAATDFDFLLYPGQYIVVTLASAASGHNPITNAWFLQCVWSEETLTTYTISGVVTLSAVGVVGAEVLVVIADDVAMTNATFWEIVTTTSGGAWSSSVPVGKYAFAYAQNDVAGTKYTSPGRPYQIG